MLVCQTVRSLKEFLCDPAVNASRMPNTKPQGFVIQDWGLSAESAARIGTLTIAKIATREARQILIPNP